MGIPAPRRKTGGYLLVDHQASPGMTEAEARLAGYDPALVKEGKRLEIETFTCKHCRASVVPNPLRTRERGSCAKCNFHYVCDLCFANMQLPEYDHMPFERLVDLTKDGRAPVLFMKPALDKAAQIILPPSMGGHSFDSANHTNAVTASAGP